LKERMHQLFWAFQLLQEKAKSADPTFNCIDFSKVVLAGYDLGAQTVAAVLGEDFKAALPANAELTPLAAILLSPSLDLAEGNFKNRFKKLQSPLLVVTGSDDFDPYAISSASARSAVWEFSPPQDKYLLSLNGNVHQLLAGANFGAHARINQNNQAEDENAAAVAGQKGGGAKLNYGGQSGGRGRRGDGGGGEDKKHGVRDDLSYKQIAAVMSATTAFLDMTIKNDEFAGYWIKDKAGKWLDRAGSLQMR
jgi:hypothetical protein